MNTQTHSAQASTLFKGALTPDLTSSDYLIKVTIKTSQTQQSLSKILQDVYDNNGVAGSYLIDSEKKGELTLRALRYVSEDADYIYPRVLGDINQESVNKAAVEQYFDELTEYSCEEVKGDELILLITEIMNNNWTVSNTDDLLKEVLSISSQIPERITDFAETAIDLANGALSLPITDDYLLLDRTVLDRFNSDRAALGIECRSVDFSDPVITELTDKARELVQCFDSDSINHGGLLATRIQYGVIKKTLVDDLKNAAELVSLSCSQDELEQCSVLGM